MLTTRGFIIESIDICQLKDATFFFEGIKTKRGRVKTPSINKKNSLYVLVWMYNEFLFFYKKSLINNLYGVIWVK